MSYITPDLHESARSQVMGLTLAQLKVVAKAERLPVSGAKVVLQDRIKERLSQYAIHNNNASFDYLYNVICNPTGPPSTSRPSLESSPLSSHSPARPTGMSSNHHTSPNGPVRLSFRPSPFFHIRQAVCPVQECKVRENTRDSFECRIRLPQDVLDALASQRSDENLRLMLYGAAGPIPQHGQPVDVSFPGSVDVKINGDEVKSNLKGLKNRPGSTRPADITDMLHKRPNYHNIMTVTWALTHRKFYMVVYLVNKINPERLIAQLKSRPKLSKDQVIREMISKTEDNEIQATAIIMSLKCPLSTLRIDIPCRSDVCTHNQCYDALSFLQLQEQAPTWTCPICNKSVQLQSLRIDCYVADILSSCSPSVEQVSIEPTGAWSPVTTDNVPQSNDQGSSDGQGDDSDLVEIQEPPRISEVHSQSLWTPPAMSRTPPYSSREPSTASANAWPGAKRTASAVIDLTNSSDEEEPVRAPKRQAVSQSTPTSMRSFDAPEPQISDGSRLSGGGISFSVQSRSDRPNNSWTSNNYFRQ